MSLRRIQRKIHQIARQRADPLRPHRISFVCHGAGAHLVLLERLLHLLQIGQKTDVPGKLVGRLADSRQRGKNKIINLARIGLPAQSHRLVKSHLRRDQAIQLTDLLMIPLEQFHETCLRSGCPLHAAHRNAFDLLGDPFHVEREILQIESKAFSHGRQLRRLIVCEAEGGHILVFFRV